MDGNVPDNAVIFIGDSITQGLCVSAIATPSVNYGIGSDTTVGVIRRIPFYKSIERASVVVLAVGINDMKHRSNKEILKNYRTIVDLIPKRTPVIFSAVLPLDMKAREKWQGRSQDRIERLNSSIEILSINKNNLYFVDAGPLLMDGNGNLSDVYHNGDGVHLNSKGYSIWNNVLRTGIKKAQQHTLEKIK